MMFYMQNRYLGLITGCVMVFVLFICIYQEYEKGFNAGVGAFIILAVIFLMTACLFVHTAKLFKGNRVIVEIGKDLLIKTKKKSARSKAKTVFNFVIDNYEYDDRQLEKALKAEKAGGPTDFYERCADEVAIDKKGLCGELSHLLIKLYRLLGFDACYVVVYRDYTGEMVDHACVGLYLKDKLILVDPAYAVFDIKHRKYKMMRSRSFKAW